MDNHFQMNFVRTLNQDIISFQQINRQILAQALHIRKTGINRTGSSKLISTKKNFVKTISIEHLYYLGMQFQTFCTQP